MQKIDISKNVDINFFKLSHKEIKEVYEEDILLKCFDVFEKMKNLNAVDLKEATKIICGSAISMGRDVKE